MARYSDREIDRNNKIKRALFLFSEVEKIPFNRHMYFDSYGQNEVEDKVSDKRKAMENRNLQFLAKLYEKLNPSWKAEFNSFEEQRKDKKFGLGNLKPDDSLYELISEVMYNDSDNASVVAMNVYLSNKIAHLCSNARDRIVEGYLLGKSGNKKLTEAQIKETSSKIKKYFIEKARMDNPKLRDKSSIELMIKNIKEELKDVKIEDRDLEKFEKQNFYKLIQMEKELFAIKDFEIVNVITRLKERDRLYNSGIETDEPMSYGMANDENGEPILVIDLPYFSQFSVHLKKESEAISALSDVSYDKEVYALETVMLTEGISPEIKEDLKKVGKDFSKIKSVARERIRNDRSVTGKNSATSYAHHVLLKSGGSKKELDNFVYNER